MALRSGSGREDRPDLATRMFAKPFVPLLPDMITGFGIFFVTVVGLTLLAILALRVYERRQGS